jgi:DNA-binding CsgD family transcriptional regulator
MDFVELTAALSRSRKENEIVSTIIDRAGQLFDAELVGIYQRPKRDAEMSVAGVSSWLPVSWVDRYNRWLRPHDPLIRFVCVEQRPIHDLQIMSADEWERFPLYGELTGGGVVRCMVAPVIDSGGVMGTVTIGRRSKEPFSSDDLVVFSSVCSHISIQLTRLRSLPAALDHLGRLLAPREIEVALLVAKGLTNREIGRALRLSTNTVKGAVQRVFRKLDVTTRTELAAALYGFL